jgi:hypothetical protein
MGTGADNRRSILREKREDDEDRTESEGVAGCFEFRQPKGRRADFDVVPSATTSGVGVADCCAMKLGFGILVVLESNSSGRRRDGFVCAVKYCTPVAELVQVFGRAPALQGRRRAFPINGFFILGSRLGKEHREDESDTGSSLWSTSIWIGLWTRVEDEDEDDRGLPYTGGCV